MANLSDCLSDATGSIPVWAANGVFSLFGKMSNCGFEEQGSPDSYRDQNTQYSFCLTVKTTVFRTEYKLER